MKFTMKHFPYLFLFFMFLSCHTQNEKKVQNNSDYTSIIEKAFAKEAAVELDSAFYYFNKAKLICTSDEKEKKYMLYWEWQMFKKQIVILWV